ncbi:permease prefix domain 2-containing transporter [Spirosoma sp. RP8]|uniref:Permease prefix domain 2-containing transporter n=2 Tax=Spirosoma liriopis TaxID=2937440 RepID=A0ABT0HMB0_9BACT|nr:FtsX-like permease family protein [Spirosoma liriopis]MCK8492695.1 permease prefix domain 2-containing transporter [Spirosoma liriopis]
MDMNQPNPPRWAQTLLRGWGDPNTEEEVQGDLLELYAYWLQTVGKRNADTRYCLSVLKLLRPLARRKRSNEYSAPYFLHPMMIWNYLKIARRQLWRNRLFTALNVVGLSIGVSACWIIYRIVAFDFSFDTQNPNRDRIVRVVSGYEVDGKEVRNPGSPLPMADAVREQIGGVERAIPVRKQWMESVQIPQAVGKPVRFKDVEDIVATDTNYFRMVPYQWLSGDLAHALVRPKQVVLTQSRASRYFPGLSPRQLLNRTLVYEDTLQMQIAGIVADLPYASDFRAQEFVSVSTFKEVASPEEWSNTNSGTQLYLMVQAGVNYKQLEGQLNDLSRKNSEAATKKWSHFKRWHLVQPLADLHFGVEYHERERRANKNVLYGLIGLAGFILTLAVINYVNLASAQIPQRAREIGIRKTLGSRRRPLIMQFLGETAVITLLAFVLAYGLSGLFFTNFSDLVPEGIDQILISCLGLFGLAALTAHQRTKEIGVRKVLGASVASVVALLSKDFVKLVIVAIGIASPLAWYVMNRWLEEFAYKIAMPWWVFVLAGVLATGIALLTVSYQSVKAALLNPVKSLRSE